MAQNSYIPTRQAQQRNWAQNFRNLVVADSARYLLAATDATAIDSSDATGCSP